MEKSEKGGRYYGWVIVFLGFMVMAVVFVASFSVNSLFVVPVCESLGVGRTTLSVYLSVSNIATLIVAPLIGRLMGKLGFRKVGTFCIALLGLSFGALSFATNIYAFYVIAVFRGIGFAGATTMLVSTMVSNWFGPKKKGTATSIAMVGSSVGGFIIMPIITRVIESYGWQWGYRALCVLVLVTMLPLMLGFAVDSPDQKGLKRLGDITDGSGVSLYGPTIEQAQRLPAFWLMLIGLMVLFCTSSALSAHAVAYLLDCGLSVTQASGVQAIGLLLMAVGKLVLGGINDKRSANAALIFGFVTSIICYLAMYSISMSTSFVPVFIVFYALGQAIGLLAPTIMITKIFGNRAFAGLIGYTTTAGGIGSAIGPLILGSIYDLSGGYGAGWLLLTAMAGLSFLLAMLAMRYDYRKVEIAV